MIPFQGSGDIEEERVERTQELEEGVESSAALCSVCDVSTAVTEEEGQTPADDRLGRERASPK